jgi:IS30 family transposase
MTAGKRFRLSEMQRAEIWRRWKAGHSLHAIGRALSRAHPVVHRLLKQHGGIAPPLRRRSLLSLTLAEREDVSREIAGGCSIRDIAKGLQRAASTVSREGGPRHGGRARYRANQADQQAWESALRPKPCRLATHTKLRKIVASKLALNWSPQQISGWLKQHYPDDKRLRMSHETIYRSLFIRAIPGHWEGDLLRGARHSHVATLVERHSRFCMLVKVPGKDTATVVAALSRHVRRLPATCAAPCQGFDLPKSDAAYCRIGCISGASTSPW